MTDHDEITTLKEEIVGLRRDVDALTSGLRWGVGLLAGLVVGIHFIDPTMHWWVFLFP